MTGKDKSPLRQFPRLFGMGNRSGKNGKFNAAFDAERMKGVCYVCFCCCGLAFVRDIAAG